MTITNIEDISDAIFFKIFKYLDGCDILKAFVNLNIRFQQLLMDSSLRFKIKLYPEMKSEFKQILIPNKHQILSLHLSDNLIINRFFLLNNIDSSFNQLQSINVQFIRANQLVLLLPRLKLLPHLFQLIIHLEDDEIYLDEIYLPIFNLLVLKYTKISSLQNVNLMGPLLIPRPRLSSIEYLIIDHSCTVDDLILILSYVPQLRYLTCKKSLRRSNPYFEKFLSINKCNLTHLYIKQCSMDFNNFEMFMKKISSQLQVLKVITFNDLSYLNAKRWEQFIFGMSQLRKFYFEYHENFYEDYKITSYHKLSNQFMYPFWIKRQWTFDISIDTLEIIYSIHPARYEGRNN
jgi:hypothetical protein